MTGDAFERKRLRKEERSLVRRMIAGDERAFDRFVDSYLPVLYRFVQGRLRGDRELTREIVQTTVCKALPKLSGFRGEAALTTWLCAFGKNEIAMHFRRQGRTLREVELKEVDVAADAGLHGSGLEGPERAVLRREQARLVHEALDALPPHYGQALEWKYLEGLPVKEIAERLELGPKAAESLLTRARNAFRDGYRKISAGLATPAGNAEITIPRTAVQP